MSSKRMRRTEANTQVENTVHRSAKRALSTSSSHESNTKKPGSTPKRYKALLTCVICNGDAHGYNFDAISCESCKAFFRRNALRAPAKLKCRGNGNCDVGFNIKKRCKKCRLEKCLRAGMRKEWILSDKEKEEKRAKIEENRRLKQLQELDRDHQKLLKRDSQAAADLSLDLALLTNQPLLTDYDWANIQSIQDCFIESVKLNQIAGILSYPYTQPIESTIELFRVPLYISSMRLITFLKQINEFQQLDKKDQVYLVKLNLLTICFFHSIFIYDPRTDSYHEENTTDPIFSGKDWIKTLNKQFHNDMKQLRNDLIDIFQMDNIIIKLFYIIILFSQQLSLNQAAKCTSADIKTINICKAQDVFTDLVYRYILHQYGPSKTPIFFAKYVHKIMKIQQLVDEIKFAIHDYMDVTQLSPLSQSLVV